MIFISNKKLPGLYWSKQADLFGNSEIRKVNSIKIDKTIYCGRPSLLGNPFSHLNTSIAKFICKQEEVLIKYEEWLNSLTKNSSEIKFLQELQRFNHSQNICLECWCKPRKCHCDIILYKIEML